MGCVLAGAGGIKLMPVFLTVTRTLREALMKGRHFAVCCGEVKMNDSGLTREDAVYRPGMNSWNQ